MRTAKIVEVDPELSLPIVMDNGDRLSKMQSVKRLQYVCNGQMKAVENPQYACVEEHTLSYSITKDYAATEKTSQSVAVGQSMAALQRRSIDVAQEVGMPVDQFHGVREAEQLTITSGNAKSDSSTTSSSDGTEERAKEDYQSKPPKTVYQLNDDTDEGSAMNGSIAEASLQLGKATGGDSEEEEVSEADNISVDTVNLNYHAMVMQGHEDRESMEATARNGQKRQAETVNRSRVGQGGEVIRKWTMCTIQLDSDRNNFTPKHLPVMVCGTYYRAATNTIRYKICTENGIIEKTFGREQLTPHPELTPDSMGINYNILSKTSLITLIQPGEMYSKLGGNLSYCRCKTDCSKSKSCKCRKLHKLCGQHCHGGAGKIYCAEIVPQNEREQ